MLKLANDTKIALCNTFFQLRKHARECVACSDYINGGDGDLCNVGHTMLVNGIAYSDTKPTETENLAHSAITMKETKCAE